jgi:hypothetical protein
MSGKKILAGIFAALVLFKLLFIMVSPGKWMNLVEVFLKHYAFIWWVYLALIIITGYYIFTSLDLIDIVLVMFFTSLVIGVSLIPFSAAWLKLGREIAAKGLGKAWMSVVIWGVLAVAVLYRLWSSPKSKSR